MLGRRLLGASLLIVPILTLIWLDDRLNFGRPGLWLLPLGLLIAAFAAAEFISMFASRDFGGRPLPAAIAAAVSFALVAVPVVRIDPDCPIGNWGWCAIGMAAAILILFSNELIGYRESRHATTRIAMGVTAVVYIVLPLSFLLYLRVQLGGRMGLVALASIIFVVKWSDAGAYFTGKLLGRRKLAPILSPGKTLEGFWGGLGFAAIAAYVLHLWLVPALGMPSSTTSVVRWIAYGCALAVAGVLGDLSESLIKRDAGVKDSGSWLPGLGGVLDVVDSLLWATPVAYVGWISGWIS